ncbi:MAG: PQQ-binding-like beta-propeller repeat protein, partial [Planctomycetaceae bacterium]|nr:PQQ-binding-like beta-propeller repeat protein [Planctomycetaceae bacterium]
IGAVVEAINWFAWGEDSTFRYFFAIYIIATTTAFALLVWWVFFSRLSMRARLTGLAAAGLAVGMFFLIFRIDGVDGVMVPQFSLRFQKSSEERAREFREQAGEKASVSSSSATERSGAAAGETRGAESEWVEISENDWPQFRGPRWDSVVTDTLVRTDWDANPPKEVWRRPCGLGWSSFAVVGNRLYTQEQLGGEESVTCYHAETGKEIWRHADPVRLDTSLGGDGPRATPTVHDSLVYSLGGTGILNCLDAATGEVKWTVDIVKDAGIDGIADNTLDWGTSGSPLVDETRVYVNPGISRSKTDLNGAVAAYDRLTGKKLWSNGNTKAGYAAPRPIEIDGVRQILIFDGAECAGYDPETGKKLWAKAWVNNQAINVAQPIPVGERSIIVSSGYAAGAMRFDVTRNGEEWTTTERWTLKNQFKLKFNDAVLRNGFLYGLDEGILACLDVETGKRTWREGRYRYGEIVVVAGEPPTHDLIVVLTENGECVLVKASGEKPEELGRFKAVTGTCWNHPVVNRGRLYVRSEQEMACYEIGTAKSR